MFGSAGLVFEDLIEKDFKSDFLGAGASLENGMGFEFTDSRG